ncbi:unnamed protein product [Peronospora belbahrii]|uniref:Integrase catalytic domain-containing protein n=1 Tax=Peronospora belbahrii TaxID=622444 RepID=A0ABN8D8W2_9STRA|nr:unnamed protein product [Peronospora belbahrii]
MKGKQTVTPFPSRTLTKSSRVLELLHTDVMGPVRTLLKGVAKLLKNKSKVPGKLKELQALEVSASNNGTEFVSKTVDEMCRRNGILHQRPVPYSPQHNGVAERKNRTIMEKARSMLHYKGVSTVWWAEVVNTAVYLINRSSNATHPDSTSYELGFKVKPCIEHLRVFGLEGYA